MTCFEGVQLLPPGHFLEITPGTASARAPTSRNAPIGKWIFPIAGDEERGDDRRKLVDEFEQLMLHAVEERLRADVPVGSYFSGGVDSSMIVGARLPSQRSRDQHLHHPRGRAGVGRTRRGQPRRPAHRNQAADRAGVSAISDALETYPRLIEAAEAPVIDTSCAALLQLAQRVHASADRKSCSPAKARTNGWSAIRGTRPPS